MLKKGLTGPPEYAKMRHVMMTHFNITMPSIDKHVPEFQYNQCSTHVTAWKR